MNLVKSLEDLDISYATVHLLNGLEALKATNEVAKKIKIKLLEELFVLETSLEMKIYLREKVEEQVLRLVKIADEANLYGVIATN